MVVGRRKQGAHPLGERLFPHDILRNQGENDEKNRKAYGGGGQEYVGEKGN